jgi:molybdopterin-guanine dinucleotide biosynthesis protein A
MMTGAPAGVVLAGGRATRLGGGDKPLRQLGARPMLGHVLERLAPQVGRMAISANGDPARFADFGLPVLADEDPSGRAGPLAGILSGLRWARREAGCERLLTVAGDTPFFPADLAARLGAATAGHANRVAVAASAGRRHPVFALWPLSLEADLKRFLAESATFSVSAFLNMHDVAVVDFPMLGSAAGETDPFFNVNTPDDLAEAEQMARRWR